MAGDVIRSVKRFILWDYSRATWQYDVMVGLILAFLLLTPREWFRDQPRIPGSSRIATLQSGHGTTVYWIDAEVLAGVPQDQQAEKVRQLLQSRSNDVEKVVRLEPALDPESEVKGYIAFTRP